MSKHDINPASFEEFPILKTNRLTLRQMTLEDAEAMYDIWRVEKANQFIMREPMAKLKDAKDIVQRCLDEYKSRDMIAWAGVLRNQKAIVGSCGLIRINHQDRRAELGGGMSIHYWGKHIAVEAAEAIVNYGLGPMNLHAVEAKVDPANRGAVHLLEYLGFEREGYFKEYGFYKGQFHDMAWYTKFAD